MRSCRHLKTLPELPGSIKYIAFCKTAVKKFPSSMWSLNQLETLMFENCKSLTDLPNSACNLKSLKRFSLYYCTSLLKFQDLPRNITWLTLAGTAIEMVPSSIGCLSHLLTLDMTFCERLECLPTTLCKLKSLERLCLSRCSKFKNFPEILEPMEQLFYLFLDGIAIEDIPSSIENLSRLGILMLDGCECLEVLPNNIYNIQGLKLSLSGLSGCSSFDKFPPLSGTCCLGELDLSRFNRLQVPVGVSSLSSLRISNLSRSKIESLPTSMKYLSTLSHLDLRKCKNLKSLLELPPFLELLQADDCASLETLSISRTEPIQGLYQYHLREVDFRYCSCPRLDQNARASIMADARFRILHMETISTSIRGRMGQLVSVIQETKFRSGSAMEVWDRQ
ncbi:disease resistance-like protein DSC1 [Ziziphus jujuba]|uniref:Disease resistance-like protein DSC1 n=1 Tax=Ziziphus jujuba TaxID=326968 RepID=A0ABM3ZVB1_ZIZJJ|nr:disease resistance-like protein DSC1 [Ziziphus jujuba]